MLEICSLGDRRNHPQNRLDFVMKLEEPVEVIHGEVPHQQYIIIKTLRGKPCFTGKAVWSLAPAADLNWQKLRTREEMMGCNGVW